VNDKSTPLFSDGINDITRDVGTIVIAGMGGQTIVKILKAHPEKLISVQTIIIDAHSAVPLARKEICQMGFAIADEQIVKEDGIFYEIVKFIKADSAVIGDEDLEFGPILRREKSAVFKEKYQSRISEIDNIIASGNLPQARIDTLNAEKHKLERYL
jgi:tRNA (adenine22-N1)-methyltransferase